MEKLSLKIYPHPILTRRMPELTQIDEDTADKVRQMFAIMYDRKGIGLAANQAGWEARVMVMNLSGDPEKSDEEMVFINPTIQSFGKETCLEEEGCLSFPELKAEVKRHTDLVLKASDLEGRDMVYHADDLFARCVQHEMDHLDGITFIDRLTPAVRATVIDQVRLFEESDNVTQ